MKRPERARPAPREVPSRRPAPARERQAPREPQAPRERSAPRERQAPRERSAPRERPARGDRAARREDVRAAKLRLRAEKAELRRFTRAARRRRIGWLVGSGILGLVATLIAIAVFSPILALREVRVEGTSRLDPVVIADAVSGQLGTPLALLDEGRLREELAAFTTIRSYTTELVPPGTLVISIVERSPIGVVVTASGFDVVDAAGVTIESVPGRPPGLPRFETDADGVEGAAFEAMAEVLLALPPEVLAQVDTITARTRDDVTLRLAGSDQSVVWGSAEDSERKARTLALLLAQFAGSGPGEYDVSAPGSAVFTPA